jgi:hypothetical protein
VQVSKRQGKLQRHCCKRQPTRAPLPGSNPTHQANLPSHAISSREQFTAGMVLRNYDQFHSVTRHRNCCTLWLPCDNALWPHLTVPAGRTPADPVFATVV